MFDLQCVLIEPEHVVDTCRAFCDCNKGDEATTDLILSLCAEILDISQDALLELL